MRRRLGVVSYFAHRRYEPRGVRTRAVVEALAPTWEVELIAGPAEEAPEPASSLVRGARFARYQAARAIALDPFEPWSRRRLRGWGGSLDGALLIGFPFSPLVQGARELHRRGIPFVVDASDPWAVTASERMMGPLAFRRAVSAERRMWECATGAILTTRQQERPLKERFPHLRTLVRPNGFREPASPLPPRHPGSGRVLRIGHFGNLYFPRVEIGTFLERLIAAGNWESVAFVHFGQDRNHTLRRLPAGVEVHAHQPVPWDQVVELSQDLDVALVIGNVGGTQLPSKVIDYLTLPIPRVALVADPDEDAISDYVEDKPGWLVLGTDDRDAADRLAAHLAKPWTDGALAPPAGESWSAVGREIASFLASCLGTNAPEDADALEPGAV